MTATRLHMPQQPPLWLVLVLRTGVDHGRLEPSAVQQVIAQWRQEPPAPTMSIEIWLLTAVGAVLGGNLITGFNRQPLRCLQCNASFTAVRQRPLELACPDCHGVVLEREAVAVPIPPMPMP